MSINEAGKSMKVEGLGKTFYSEASELGKLSSGYFSTKTEDYQEEEPYYSENFSTYYGSEANLEYIIQQETASI